MTLLHGFLFSAPCQACLMMLIKWMVLLVQRISLIKLLTSNALVLFFFFSYPFFIHFRQKQSLKNGQDLENNGEVLKKMITLMKFNQRNVGRLFGFSSTTVSPNLYLLIHKMFFRGFTTAPSKPPLPLTQIKTNGTFGQSSSNC